MKNKIILLIILSALTLLALAGCQKRTPAVITVHPVETAKKDYYRPLPPGQMALRKITDPSRIPDYTQACSETDRLREAIANSLHYLAKPSSRTFYPYGDISYEQAVESLRELDKLFASELPPRQINEILHEKFDTYVSVGCDDQGTVLFTGYYTPIFDGSPVRTGRFQYPLYKAPEDLVKGPDGAILGQKGADGKLRKIPGRQEIQQSNAFAGNEIAWLADPFEVYIAHVQGSVKIRMPDGQIETVGYAAHNGWEYRGIAPRMIADGKLTRENTNLRAMIDYFKLHPEDVDNYVNLNPRFVFFNFQKTEPHGSLNEPVIPFRTIATDKGIYPRAMFVFADVALARPVGFVLDQDTGGAIRAAGRCDVYMGTGDHAGELAGGTFREGKLYYLFIKPVSGMVETNLK